MCPRIFFFCRLIFQLSEPKLITCILEVNSIRVWVSKSSEAYTKKQSLSVQQTNIIIIIKKKNKTVSDRNPRNIIFLLNSCKITKKTCFQNVLPCFCSQFTAHPKISWSILPSSAASPCSPIRLTSGRVKSFICCPRICTKTRYIHSCITAHIQINLFHTKMFHTQQQQFILTSL